MLHPYFIYTMNVQFINERLVYFISSIFAVIKRPNTPSLQGYEVIHDKDSTAETRNDSVDKTCVVNYHKDGDVTTQW